MKRLTKLVGASIILLASAMFVLTGAAAPVDAENSAEEERKAPLVETLSSQASPHANALNLRGVTEAARKVTISAQTSGLVVSEPRRKGERIRKGAVLCEIEKADRGAKLEEAKARLVEAEAVAKASTELGKKGFASETTRARDRAALEAARASVKAMELELTRTRMVAPFDGWLETDTAELGALLSLGAPCATLLELDPIRLVGFAAEGDVGKLRIGQPVVATLTDGRSVEAAISFVARAADGATRTFRVEASAPNKAADPDGLLRDGATAILNISLGERPGHKLPRSALMIDDQGRLGVMLAKEGKARFQRVEILADGKDGLWISGPPDKAEIVVTGQYYLSDGVPIRTAPYRPTGAKDAEQ